MAKGEFTSRVSKLAAAFVMLAGVAYTVRTRRPLATAVVVASPAEQGRAVQHERANEHGRGRTAQSPLAFPWPAWKDILWRTYQEIQNDRVMAIAAGVVFFSLLALFPAITAAVSIYALFADAGTIEGHIASLSALLPGGAVDIVSEQVRRIVERGTGQLSVSFAIGLAIALWSANAGMKAIFDALNVIYDEREKRGFIKLNAISMLVTLAALALALLMFASVAVVPLALRYLESIGAVGGMLATAVSYGRWPALFLVVVLALGVLYWIGPSRETARWQWVSVGSIFAAVVWLVVSIAFSWYVANFGNYNATYGSLGAAIGMMMWMWLSVIVVLVGAELNSEVEHQTARDSTTGAPRPLGARGATMADSVGAAQA